MSRKEEVEGGRDEWEGAGTLQGRHRQGLGKRDGRIMKEIRSI